MARTFNITDGTTTINLINTSATGIIASRGGFGRSKFAPHQYDEARGIEEYLFVDRWALNVAGSDHDDLASKTQDLIMLLRKAYQYHTDPKEKTPVYITQQTTGETGARYSLVYQSPEISAPDYFDLDFEVNDLMENYGVNIARFIWRNNIPGNLPTAETLTETDGPASPTKVHVSNHRDDLDITSIFVADWDSGPAYSTDHAGATSWSLFPAGGVASSDSLFIGSSDGPLKHVVLPKLSTAAAITTSTLTLYYYNGSWTALSLGSDYTIFPKSTWEDCLEQTSDDIVCNINVPSDIATTAINGVTAYWYLLKEAHATPSWGTVPVASASDAAYAQRTPAIEVSSDAINGDTFPYACMRLYAPAGGDENEGFANISRVVIGAKRDYGTFVSRLNAGGNDNSTDWTVTQGTDATATTDAQAPGEAACYVSFATTETADKRVSFTGDGRLDDWKGEYRVFVTAQQIGGSASDIGLFLRTYIHETNTYSPKYDTAEVYTQGADQGAEVFDLGLLKLPFGETADTDDLTDADIIFEIHAERISGSATLRIYELVLIPVDEWSCELDDPVTDTVNGTSALRGNGVIDVDGGVLANRTLKYLKSGSYLYPSDTWGRGGPPLKVEPGKKTRLYFLMMHYPDGGTWGTGPFISSIGCHLAFELYTHDCFMGLRGSE